MKTEAKIAQVLDGIKALLVKKNFKYGDSALDPVRIFSEASVVEQLLVRIDDKLSRIKRGVGLLAADEDVIQDLIGYLVLLSIALQDQSDDLKKKGANQDQGSTPNNLSILYQEYDL